MTHLLPDELRIVPAQLEDSEDIWQWRNDPDTIRNSNSSLAVPWESHDKWYRRTLNSDASELLIGMVKGGEKVGMVRFDVDAQHQYLICSINLNPAWRNKGLATPLLGAAIAHRKCNHHWPIYAEIKPANVASIKCFERNGFQYIQSAEGVNRYLRPENIKVD